MATGGTLPTNRTQTVTFFDTAGIVDKEKNIYFAPRFSKYTQTSSGRDVRSAYLEIFKQVCPPSSAYADIQISGWSPQDRTLKVRGNIDDFRLVTEEGDCLNYFILSRTITNEDVEKTFYYGFFITGVQQAGGGSVLLTVEPDDFTNVFYLHNQHMLTAEDIENDYDVFNVKIKNAYVNRQHYNRVGYKTKTITHTDHYEGESNLLTVPTGQAINAVAYEVPVTNSGVVSNESHRVRVEVGSGTYNVFYTLLNNVLTYTIQNTGNTEFKVVLSYSFDIVWTEEITQLEPDNMKVFLNQEETFRFKYQYRDMKYPLSIYNGNFTDEEISLIESEDMFNKLPQELRTKILKACLSYLVVELKSDETLIPFYSTDIVDEASHTATVTSKVRIKNGQLINDNISRTNPVICIPFYNVPEVFEKYNYVRKGLDFGILYYNIRFHIRYGEIDTTLSSNMNSALEKLVRIINNGSIANYIYSVYITKEINIPDDYITIEYGGNYPFLTFSVTFPEGAFALSDIDREGIARFDKKELYLTGLLENPIKSGYSEVTESISFSAKYDHGALKSYDFRGLGIALCVSGFYKNEFSIKIKEQLKDLTVNYWDNVLEAEPYSFYSLSYLSGYELSFNKNRYYEGLESEIKIIHYVSINGAVKEGFIPLYTVDNKTSKYFNEGLMFTNSSDLPLYTDSYASFYYQNKAQMKNQYAVNNYQNGTDLLQRFFLSAPNQVGQRAFRAGGYGAISETINQVAGMVDDTIDWAQSDKVIGMNQKAKLADMGAKPDTLKQTGSDIIFDLATKETQPFLNHYRIDELSYNSIAKLFERTGYQVNLFTTLNTMDRVGWNFIKLNSCDVVGNITLTQESTIRKIFTEGVTLLHDKSYLTSGHNFETILEGGE